MTKYRCYLFNQHNRIDRIVDFSADSDAQACEEADRLHAQAGYGFLELWRDAKKVYCPGSEAMRA